jgi:hypothetical protein
MRPYLNPSAVNITIHFASEFCSLVNSEIQISQHYSGYFQRLHSHATITRRTSKKIMVTFFPELPFNYISSISFSFSLFLIPTSKVKMKYFISITLLLCKFHVYWDKQKTVSDRVVLCHAYWSPLIWHRHFNNKEYWGSYCGQKYVSN